MVSLYGGHFLYDGGDTKSYKQRPMKVNKDSLFDVISNQSEYSIFFSLIQMAKLEKKYNSLSNKYTVFIPTDQQINSKYSQEELSNINYDKAKQIVLYHTLNKTYDPNYIRQVKYSTFSTTSTHPMNKKITIQNNENLRIKLLINNKVHINSFHKGNISNGFIYLIDDFICPESLKNNFLKSKQVQNSCRQVNIKTNCFF